MNYVNKIRSRLHYQNKNWLGLIVGETGSGKSYSAIALANLIAGSTNKVYIVFTPIEFFKLLDSGTLKKGDVIVADEFGVSMSAREWQSVQNKMMGLILQVFRHMNLAVIFTVPHLSFIDVQARKLLHCYLETATIDYKNKTASLKVYEIEVSSKFDKIYYKNPVMIDESGREVKVTHLIVDKPTDDQLKEYEVRKEEFSKKLRADAVLSLEKATAIKEDKSNIKPKQDLNVITDEIISSDKYFKTYKSSGKKSIIIGLVKQDYSLPEHVARQVKSLVEKKMSDMS